MHNYAINIYNNHINIFYHCVKYQMEEKDFNELLWFL